jgi:hypothetical protein
MLKATCDAHFEQCTALDPKRYAAAERRRVAALSFPSHCRPQIVCECEKLDFVVALKGAGIGQEKQWPRRFASLLNWEWHENVQNSLDACVLLFTFSPGLIRVES